MSLAYCDAVNKGPVSFQMEFYTFKQQGRWPTFLGVRASSRGLASEAGSRAKRLILYRGENAMQEGNF